MKQLVPLFWLVSFGISATLCSLQGYLDNSKLYLPLNSDSSGPYHEFPERDIFRIYGFQPGQDKASPNKFKQFYTRLTLQNLKSPRIIKILNMFSIMVPIASNDAGLCFDQIISFLNTCVKHLTTMITGVELIKTPSAFVVKFVGNQKLLEQVLESIKSSPTPASFKIMTSNISPFEFDVYWGDSSHDLCGFLFKTGDIEIPITVTRLELAPKILMKLKLLPNFSFRGLHINFFDNDSPNVFTEIHSTLVFSVLLESVEIMILRAIKYRQWKGKMYAYSCDLGASSISAITFASDSHGLGVVMKVHFKRNSNERDRTEAVRLLMRSIRMDHDYNSMLGPSTNNLDHKPFVRFNRTGKIFPLRSISDFLDLKEQKQWPTDIQSAGFYLELAGNIPPANASYQIAYLAKLPYTPELKMRLLHVSLDEILVKKNPILDILYRIVLRQSETDPNVMEYWWILNDSRFSWYNVATDELQIPGYFTAMESLLWGLQVPDFKVNVIGINGLKMDRSNMFKIGVSFLDCGEKTFECRYNDQDYQKLLSMARMNAKLVLQHGIDIRRADRFHGIQSSLLDVKNRLMALDQQDSIERVTEAVSIKVRDITPTESTEGNDQIEEGCQSTSAENNTDSQLNESVSCAVETVKTTSEPNIETDASVEVENNIVGKESGVENSPTPYVESKKPDTLHLGSIGTRVYEIKVHPTVSSSHLILVDSLDSEIDLKEFHEILFEMVMTCKRHGSVEKLQYSLKQGLRIYGSSPSDLQSLFGPLKEALNKSAGTSSAHLVLRKILN